MSQLPEPTVSLFINGLDVGAEFFSHVLDFTWTDNLHGTADEIATRMRDDLGLWRGSWGPEEKDIAAASIGYKGGLMMPCGIYEVDIPDAGGSRGNDWFNFRASSAFGSTAQRTQRSEGKERTDLKQVIEGAAGRLGYSVSGNIEPIKFGYKRQRRETDLGYIRRLSEDYGYFVSIKHKQLVFYKREELERQSPIRLYSRGGEVIRWRAKGQMSRTYKEARVSYLDPSSKKVIKANATDPDAKSGDILKIDERVENEEQAEKLAKGRLAKANEDKRTGSLTVVGDPTLVAGTVIGLDGSYGRYAGKYLVHKATHSLKRANYTTKLDLKGI